MMEALSAGPAAAPAAPESLGPSPVEVWHRRLVLFSVTTTLALGAEVGYAQLVPKMPQLYAILLRAAVWDCVLVGVFVAQLIDLSSLPILAGTDGGHYLPVAVLLYHAIKMTVCILCDACSRGTARGRLLHRSFVSRRVLLELAGGATGSKLFLGRVCFVVSGGAMYLALRILIWIDDGTSVLTGFIVLLHASYCAAGFAALEPRRTGHGRLVQWLCTGWGSREAFLQGPLKVVGAIFLLPFAMSAIAAQIWLRTVAFIVWLTVACPCCRLSRDHNVYDAFEREMVVPLLQCSFLAFACTLAAMVIGFAQLTSMQRMVAGTSAVYYTLMMLFWTTPVVLQAKVSAEEAFDAAVLLGEGESQTQPLRERHSGGGESDVELEDIRSTCDELRALLYRERHDHSVELAQLQSKLRDQELRTRTAERAAQETKAELLDVARRHEASGAAQSAASRATAPGPPPPPPSAAAATAADPPVLPLPSVSPPASSERPRRPELPRIRWPADFPAAQQDARSVGFSVPHSSVSSSSSSHSSSSTFGGSTSSSPASRDGQGSPPREQLDNASATAPEVEKQAADVAVAAATLSDAVAQASIPGESPRSASSQTVQAPEPTSVAAVSAPARQSDVDDASACAHATSDSVRESTDEGATDTTANGVTNKCVNGVVKGDLAADAIDATRHDVGSARESDEALAATSNVDDGNTSDHAGNAAASAEAEENEKEEGASELASSGIHEVPAQAGEDSMSVSAPDCKTDNSLPNGEAETETVQECVSPSAVCAQADALVLSAKSTNSDADGGSQTPSAIAHAMHDAPRDAEDTDSEDGEEDGHRLLLQTNG